MNRDERANQARNRVSHAMLQLQHALEELYWCVEMHHTVTNGESGLNYERLANHMVAKVREHDGVYFYVPDMAKENP